MCNVKVEKMQKLVDLVRHEERMSWNLLQLAEARGYAEEIIEERMDAWDILDNLLSRSGIEKETDGRVFEDQGKLYDWNTGEEAKL